MGKSTNKELVADLIVRNASGKYNEMIDEAKAGEYHDFKNLKYVCGKVELINKLDKFPELSDIREAVVNGEYDESPDEKDKVMIKQDLIDSMGEEKAAILLKNLNIK